MDIAAFFAAHPLLAPLPARARDRVAAVSLALPLLAGETSNAAEADGHVVLVAAGALRVSWLIDGRIVFHDVEAGGAHGLLDAVLGRVPPAAALLALSDCEALVVPAATGIAAIRSSAQAAAAMAQMFAAALDRRAASSDPLQLVYRDILRAAKPMGDTRWTIDPMPRHRELAQRAGVGEEEAASAIANLVRLGVARRRYPALDIEDRDALRALAL